jgi:hypothetical protein
MLKFEDFAKRAFDKREYRESLSYYRRILDSCPESVRHTCCLIECMISSDPFDMTDVVSFTTKV